MPGASRAELYFISAMMFLILVLCVGAVYVFIKTYKKEMREKAERRETERLDAEKSVREEQNAAS
jgi:flagellar basal body-associated protein FliL